MMQINRVSHNLQKQHKSSITELLWEVITLKFQKLLKTPTEKFVSWKSFRKECLNFTLLRICFS